MTATVVDPDQRAVLAHLDSPRFQVGVHDGRWRLIDHQWPYVVVGVRAAPRDGGPDEFALRIDLTGYPAQAPTGTPWDLQTGTALAAGKRPKGHVAGHVFRPDWEGGRALYAAWDRVALAGHPDWRTTHEKVAWTPDRDLTFWLANVWQVLNSEDYLGV